MKEGNPFVLVFGKKTIEYISRPDFLSKIVGDFTGTTYPNPVYIITGVRGSGKSVLLTTLYQELDSRNDWVCADLNAERDMLSPLASQLIKQSSTKGINISAEISLGFKVFGVSVSAEKREEDIEVELEEIISALAKEGKRILITIDDVVANEPLRIFAHTYQNLVRKDYPVFLAMTGLYENILSAQREKSLTFLPRAPQLSMKPLDLVTIAASYKRIFSLSEKESVEMAKLTNGYPYAYQLLGFLYYESDTKTIDDAFLSEYDHYLSDSVYERIWTSLTPKEQNVLLASIDPKGKGMIVFNKKNNSVYRERLLSKGLLYQVARGRLEFVLPRFNIFLQNKFLFLQPSD